MYSGTISLILARTGAAPSTVAERQFRKVQGYRDIPALLTALANPVSKKTVVEHEKVA